MSGEDLSETFNEDLTNLFVTQEEQILFINGHESQELISDIKERVKKYMVDDIDDKLVIKYKYLINLTPLVDIRCGLPIPLKIILVFAHNKIPFVVFFKCYLNNIDYIEHIKEGCINAYNRFIQNVSRPLSNYDNARIKYVDRRGRRW